MEDMNKAIMHPTKLYNCMYNIYTYISLCALYSRGLIHSTASNVTETFQSSQIMFKSLGIESLKIVF